MPKWTDQQRDAIADRGHSLIVCAAAGSGKTAVLVERIVQLVREGCPIENMLVVTFTNAAAGEMRQRIGEALSRAAREEPALGEQVMALSRASISTLHRFCGSLLREHFQALAIDPGFRIGDEQECGVLSRQAMEDAIYSCYEVGSDAFLAADRCYAQEELGELAAVEREAKVVAARIHELVGTPFYDAKTETERPLRYRDMAVLMRAARGSAPLAAQMLESEGIPVFCDAGEGYFDIPEIRAMTALLQTIENGARDEPLLAALRGPALGLTESELAQIRIRTPDAKIPYYEAVRRYREEEEDALAAVRPQSGRGQADRADLCRNRFSGSGGRASGRRVAAGQPASADHAGKGVRGGAGRLTARVSAVCRAAARGRRQHERQRHWRKRGRGAPHDHAQEQGP